MTDAPLFELRASQAEETLIVEVIGEVDLATAPELATMIAAVPGSVRRVVVDLSAVSFFDSSGLNALVHGQRELAKREAVFRVVSPADSVVRKVFEITQLIGPLGVVETLGAALA